MPELKHGLVSLAIPEHIPMPEKAGKLSDKELSELARPRRGIGLTAEMTADAMSKNPERLPVPGVTAAGLVAQGKAAEDIDLVINDVEVLLMTLKQANRLLDVEAYESLRRVLAFVRAQEKFDPRIADLVPHLIAYFANSGKSKAPAEPVATKP